jgi:hypothetical protein
MKAWDAISVGAPVLATPVPPVDRWPAGLALVAAAPGEFATAAERLVSGALDTARPDRLAFAAANGWAQRAATVIDAIRAVREVGA